MSSNEMENGHRRLGPEGHDERQPLLNARSSSHSANSQAPSELSPLNVVYVRVFHASLVVLLALSLFWLGALTVDMFYSLGMHNTAGSGFEVLVISLLSLVSLLVTLLFYVVPSATDRLLGYITAFCLLVDTILVFAVPQLRHRIGVLNGSIAFLGALVVFCLGSFSDLIVGWGKDKEELRITGHIERRKTLTEWFLLFLSNIFRLVILVLVLLVTSNIIVDVFDSNVKPLGTMVTVKNVFPVPVNVHLACTPAGTDGPLVIVEAGESSAEETVGWVLGANKVKTICYWDRPGYGFSDNTPSPAAMGITMDLLLDALIQTVPDFKNQSLLLVGNGVGGLYSRVLAGKLADQVQGIMLVDALHEELFYDQEGIFRGLKQFFEGLVTPLGIGKLGSLFSGHGSASRVYGRFEGTQGRLHKALLQQQVTARRQSRHDIGQASLELPGSTPLLVVSSSKMIEKNREWSTYQRLLLKLSDNVLAWKILDGPHELWRNRKAAQELSRLLTSFAQYD